MSISSPYKAPQKTYRHFSIAPVPVAPAPAVENKKLDFLYVGKRSGVIDRLIKTFESGYAAENTDQARTMLRRLTAYSTKGPDVIIVEGSLGHNALFLFYQFISSTKLLSNVPFFVEGSDLTPGELEKFGAEPFADDVIALEELGNEKLVSKIKFWRKIRQRISEAQEPVKEELTQVSHSPADFSKRAFDIAISSLLLVILSPVFLLIMLALRIESKGPLFYISKRAGRGYNIFNFYKFRTMDAEANSRISDFSHLNLYNPLRSEGPLFIKIDNDPRITRLGAFLRKCSLDELPQLWNVLKGDMSLVGNRPLPLYEAATLTTDEWAKRFMVPAGMTGLWQIKKKSRSKMTAEERISLDINYADKSNFLFDLWIMANTPYAVIQRTNA